MQVKFIQKRNSDNILPASENHSKDAEKLPNDAKRKRREDSPKISFTLLLNSCYMYINKWLFMEQ